MGAPEVLGQTWDDFIADFQESWQPGQHIAIVAPTGQGKTNVLCSLLPLRKFVLGVDPKGGDDTLAKAKLPRLTQWPPKGRDYDKMARGEPVRYVVGRRAQTRADRAYNRSLMGRVLPDVFDQGGWTVAIDELQILADRRFMGLADDVEELLISARYKRISIVSLFQRPANVPRAAYEMASWIFLGLTLDVDTVNRLAEITGRARSEIRGAVSGLSAADYSWLIVPGNPRRPLIVTIPREAGTRSMGKAPARG